MRSYREAAPRGDQDALRFWLVAGQVIPMNPAHAVECVVLIANSFLGSQILDPQDAMLYYPAAFRYPKLAV
jgi:hypothetical protein